MKLSRMIGTAAMALMATTFACTPSPNTRAPKANQNQAAEIEGVERIDNMLRLKPGSEWVEQPNGTVALRGAANGGAVDTLALTCACNTGPYHCQWRYAGDKSTIVCERISGSNCLSCKFRAQQDSDKQ